MFAMPGKILPDKLVERLAREGKTNAEIRDYLLEHESIDVTPQAISMWRRRRGEQREIAWAAIPRQWHVSREHAALQPARVIRWFARRQAGLPLAEQESRILDRALARLAEVDGVLTYVAGTPEGWFTVARRPGVDKGIIREPDED